MLQANQPAEGGIRPAPKSARWGVRLFIALAATGIVVLVGYFFTPTKQATAPHDEISIAAALQALERGDFALATPALRTWAEAGDAGAQFALARMYANGRGVPEDGKAAELWYRRAGRQGDARALAELGRLYLDGKKVPQNSREALKLFEEAASKGSALGALELGILYYHGEMLTSKLETGMSDIGLEIFKNKIKNAKNVMDMEIIKGKLAKDAVELVLNGLFQNMKV